MLAYGPRAFAEGNCSPAMPDRADPPPPRPASGTKPARRIPARELLGSAREVVLLHGPDEYRLRLTSKGKLILTK